MYGIEAVAPQAVLRSAIIEIQRQRKHLSLADKSRCFHDVFRRNVVERADFVFRTPAPPIAQPLGRGGYVLEVYFGFRRFGHSIPLVKLLLLQIGL